MKLIVVMLALIAAGLFISGCVEPPMVQPPAPAGQMIPIPIPSNYLQNNSVTTAKLAGNSTVFNFTTNITEDNVLGTAFLSFNTDAVITLEKTSAVMITYTGSTNFTAGNTSFVRATVGGVTANPGAMRVKGAAAGLYNTTALSWYNASVSPGTYTVSIEGNSTNAGGALYHKNSSLMVVAYPN